MFQKAVKHQEKLRMCLAGVAGSGKTYSALRVACAMGKVAFADTEHASARKYADDFNFDHVEVDPPYHPDRIGAIVDSAIEGGYDVLIIDSMSHFWQGKGGLLEEVDVIARAKTRGNTFMAWKDATPIQVAMIEKLLAAPIHLIICLRSKMEFGTEEYEDHNGKKKIRPYKIGLSPIQRSDLQYEFDVYGQLTQENDLLIEKTRCSALNGKIIHNPGEELAQALLEWTNSGIEAPPKEDPDPMPDWSKSNGNGNGNIYASVELRNVLRGLMETRKMTQEQRSFVIGQLNKDDLKAKDATLVVAKIMEGTKKLVPRSDTPKDDDGAATSGDDEDPNLDSVFGPLDTEEGNGQEKANGKKSKGKKGNGKRGKGAGKKS